MAEPGNLNELNVAISRGEAQLGMLREMKRQAERQREMEEYAAVREARRLEFDARARIEADKKVAAAEAEVLRAAELVRGSAPYVERCMREMECIEEIDRAHPAFREEKALREYVSEVHRRHNDALLEEMVFPGCDHLSEHRKDSDYDGDGEEEKCTWTYGAKRCSCGNRRILWDIPDDFDWFDREQFSIDSEIPVGEKYEC
ncbi:MAG: hypothetical protein Harvfovirus5_45 [Harvfovirus sp.]|uniref:Uncharacterized protein n=1 Tax=Harvfovirus sp. TaxID=2487768 RepID=A0A3G5A3H7_9VIRU|nr:MAG: hypothetical protein Harvfovirus5_45 [Harvfovirus sp.]